jgi:hypothetical protein
MARLSDGLNQKRVELGRLADADQARVQALLLAFAGDMLARYRQHRSQARQVPAIGPVRIETAQFGAVVRSRAPGSRGGSGRGGGSQAQGGAGPHRA